VPRLVAVPTTCSASPNKGESRDGDIEIARREFRATEVRISNGLYGPNGRTSEM
jgi:hypothetical protein